MPEAQIAQHLASPRHDDDADTLELWAEHADAFRVFRAMKTQWRITCRPSGALVRTGLDYAALPAVEDRLQVRLDEDGLERLQVMEAAAQDLLNT